MDTTTYTAGLATKQNVITGFLSDVLTSNATAYRVAITSSSGKLTTSGITTAELNFIDGITSNVQTQLDTHSTNIATLSTTILNTYTKDQSNAQYYKISSWKQCDLRDSKNIWNAERLYCWVGCRKSTWDFQNIH